MKGEPNCLGVCFWAHHPSAIRSDSSPTILCGVKAPGELPKQTAEVAVPVHDYVYSSCTFRFTLSLAFGLRDETCIGQALAAVIRKEICAFSSDLVSYFRTVLNASSPLVQHHWSETLHVRLIPARSVFDFMSIWLPTATDEDKLYNVSDLVTF